MSRHPNMAFAPTQPEEVYQRRLVKQKRWRRLGPFVPNEMPLGQRVLYSVLSLTWVAWGAIGLLSGHMYLLISRRGPVHFQGPAALFFSAAVLLSALLCAVKVVDHFDRRDNESTYQQARRWLFRASLLLILVSIVVSCIQAGSATSEAPGSWALLRADELRLLLKSRWLEEQLQPWQPAMNRWLYVSLMWLVCGGLIIRLVGAERLAAWPAVATPMAFLLLMPVLATFTLCLVWSFTSGEFPPGSDVGDGVRSNFAWRASMLVVCAGAWLLVLGTGVMLLMRLLGRWRMAS